MITKTDLMDWLRAVDKKVESKITLVAVGGTALTLTGLKSSTKDIDFCIDSKNTDIFRKIIKKEKFKIDLFYDGFIFSEQLPDDYIQKSNKIKTGLMNIELRVLSFPDIIITKAARYNERDAGDIEAIAKTNKVKKEELVNRFKQVKEIFAGNEADYEYHFNLVLKRHFG